jgi:hypothetical protein
MKRTLRLRPLLKRLLQIAGILIIAQSIVDYRRSRAAPQTTTSPPTNNPPANRDQKVFIASIHWNNEKILRSHWIPALLDLVAHLGESNVFVSVQESGSWDDSKGALRELDAALGAKGVRRRIVLDETTHADEIGKTPAGDGWIQTSRSGETKELRRVPYLAKLRNLVLEPLEELAREEGEVFERVVWLNDVVFTVCTADSLPMHSISKISIADVLLRFFLPDSRCAAPARHQRGRLRGCVFARLLQTTGILRHFRAARLGRPCGYHAVMALLQIKGFPRRPQG